ncbi:MAG: hypothetical protein HDQ91_04620, partial [Desulfovibrio sp.]|nr:hypothetical protein [Desulfovibrio sp.]
ICGFPEAELARLFRQVQKEYGANTIFDKHMQQNLLTLARNVELARKKGISALNEKTILKSTLPESHFRQIRF